MRTTLTIDDSLLQQAKIVAVRSKRTVGSVVEDALRKFLTENDIEVPSAISFGELSHGRGGLRPGIDISDNAAMQSLLDEELHDSARR